MTLTPDQRVAPIALTISLATLGLAACVLPHTFTLLLVTAFAGLGVLVFTPLGMLLGRGIDFVNEKLGALSDWLVLLAVLISAGNATLRYLFSIGSNAWLEVQWYLFAGIILLGASHTLRMNEHVRVDIFYGNISDRARLWIDTLGIFFFLLPAMSVLAYMAWPVFYGAWMNNEASSNPGGLIRWPVKLLLPLGFLLVGLQGLSELAKRIAALRGQIHLATNYEKPLQ